MDSSLVSLYYILNWMPMARSVNMSHVRARETFHRAIFPLDVYVLVKTQIN